MTIGNNTREAVTISPPRYSRKGTEESKTPNNESYVVVNSNIPYRWSAGAIIKLTAFLASSKGFPAPNTRKLVT
jgi:hypothetical protein